jgi:gliding motility-associated-like protein
MSFLKRIFLLLLVLFAARDSKANHIYGADLFYTHIIGNVYNITMVIYADCNGSPAFSGLSTAAPEIVIFRNDTVQSSLTLSIQNPSTGIEVTPVCASQLNNTTCVSVSGTLPGVKKFTYSASVSLSGTAIWKFYFNGELTNGTQAGRSTSIDNINPPPPPQVASLMGLEATLNNKTVANSSPTYTTIPTPFFSVNKAANYNPGTVDPNSDSLAYALVPGIDAYTPGVVSYKTGYSYLVPVNSTGFSFSAINGQMNFTPVTQHRALVVTKVSEYRNGVLVGTSMREMTFVILVNGNNPPGGSIIPTSGGTAISPTALQACKSAGTASFNITPTDADGNAINVQASGVPAGAVLNITGNNTASPQISFSWNISGVTPGTYTFFVTYTDNGCPLSSKQTVAYTVFVQPAPVYSFTLLAAATCTSKAAFRVTHTGLGAWMLRIYQGTTLIDSTISALPNINDSLPPGTYTFRVSNNSNCFKDTVITIVNPTTTKVNLSIDRPTCNNFTDGAITAVGYNSTAPYLYALNGGAFSSSNSFTGLGAGTYTVYVKDQPGCVKDSTFILYDSLTVVLTTASVKNVLCNGDATGEINTVAGGGHGAYKYFLNILPAASQGLFTNLIAGPYTFRVEDVAGCYFDTAFTVTQPLALSTAIAPVNIDCYGNASGSISVVSSGGVMPHVYNINNGAFGTTANFNNLVKGTYFLSVKDSNGCLRKDTVTLTEPPPLYVNSIGVINPRCTGDANGVILVNISGGTPPFTYAANTLPYHSFHHITDLPQGTYTVHIKDANGCIKDSTVVLVDPPPIGMNFSTTKALCYPLATGSVTLGGLGGTPPYVYAVDGTGYTDYRTTYYELRSGQHTLYVKDDNECVIDTVITIEDSLAVDGGIAVKDISCFGLENGEIKLQPTSGFPPFRISVNGGPLSRQVVYAPLKAGSYAVSIRDTVGCRLDTTLVVQQPELLTVDTFVTHSNCYTPGGTGAIKLEVAGGTKPYKFAWSTSATDSTSEVTGLREGDYFVRVVDNNNCRDSAVVAIEYTDCCTPMIANAFTPNGDGKNDVFRVAAKGGMTLKMLAVFNRLGQRVFFTENINDSWDGTMNGTPAEVGTYFYYIKATCGSSNEHAVDIKGDIILVR